MRTIARLARIGYTDRAMFQAFTVSLIASLATGFGAVILLVFKRITMRVYDVMIGFSAGVMASAAEKPHHPGHRAWRPMARGDRVRMRSNDRLRV